MNVKNNRLIRETDEKIIRAVYTMMTQEQRPIGKITVREICERTGVHRSTFYAHYRDVYDLVEKVEESMSRRLTEAFFRKLDEGASARDCFIEIFAFIREHREFYLYYLSESRKYGILRLAWDTIRSRYAAAANPALLGARSQEEMEYHGIFFLVGMSAAVRMWLRNGCREEPGALYDILLRQSAVQNSMLSW